MAYQQSSGSTGYNYGGYRDQGGVGDGGNTIWLANSYWSDFNGEDERSWQASYGLDFGGLGLPGLSWTTAQGLRPVLGSVRPTGFMAP